MISGMYAISLTSIPPRFGQLPQVLGALVGQVVRPDVVFLTIPKRYRRFESRALPALPFGVELIEPEDDPGPIGKLRPAGARYDGDLLICDDDWLYAPDWAAAFLRARDDHPKAVLAASSWESWRIGRPGRTVPQGFAGVMFPSALARTIPEPPEAAWSVDDVWMAGHLPEVVAVPDARGKMRPLAEPGALQLSSDRDAANRAAAALWPDD